MTRSFTPLFGQSGTEGWDGWQTVNDGVMGGRSTGGFLITKRNTAVFQGVLSLENNGGFASVRSPMQPTDLSWAAGLSVHVRGDGRRYQLRLRTDGNFDGIAYRAFFNTIQDEWVRIDIPFRAFAPTFRGRSAPEAGDLDSSRIQSIGFMIADKRPGVFRLEVAAIEAFPNPIEDTPRA